MKLQPPHSALKFLRWFCREDYIEEIEGDLTEIFEKQAEQFPARAKRKFIWSVVKYFRPEFIKSFKTSHYTNPVAMFRHNLLITYRNFLRYKSSFLINLIGLSSGLASVLLIYLWVFDELSFDKFHKKDERLFQVMRNITEGGTLYTEYSNSDLLAPALAAEMPEIEYVVPARFEQQGLVTDAKKSFKATGQFAGSDFFRAFSYELIDGVETRVLLDKYAIVVSDELAIKLFGTLSNIRGTSVTWTHPRYGNIPLIVSGIFKKPPHHVSEPFDFVVTNELFLEKSTMDKNWNSNPILTYLTLKEGVDVNEFNRKVAGFIKTKNKESNEQLFLIPFSSRYLFSVYENGKQSGGRIDYVILFSCIAVFILVIACINFMNLSTARASRRLKEVGIKKAIGVLRKTLIFQHLGESLLLAFISLIVSVLLVWMMLPQFNLITGKDLSLTFDKNIIPGALTITMITGLVSGSYPAFYLSGFRPVEVLKGKLSTSMGELWARKGLVIFQFSISILLIVAVVIIYNQMNYVRTKNLGYKKDHLVTFQKEGKISESLEEFLMEAKNTPGVVNAACTDGLVINFTSTSGGHQWEGKADSHDQTAFSFSSSEVGYDFFETLGLDMTAGRTFSRDFKNEDSKIILNETAVKEMQLKDPIGKWMIIWGRKMEVIGIVKDFHFKSLYEEIRPLILFCYPNSTSTVIVKIQPGTETETLTRIEKLYNRFNPGLQFDFKFLDSEYQALYISEQRVAGLSKYFATIAIVISCLGLFGLVAFAAERRIKEIGIRKTFGASEFMIVRMLSGDFTKMLLVAIVITLPVSYFLAGYWLESFAYQIDLKWWFFAAAGLSALFIAWLIVGAQTIKAARANPVESLRSE